MTAFAPSPLATAALLLTISCAQAQPARSAQSAETGPLGLRCTATAETDMCDALDVAMRDRWPDHFVAAPSDAQQSQGQKLLHLTYAPTRAVTNGLTGRLLWTLEQGPDTEARGESPELGMIIMDRELRVSDIQDFARQLVGATEFPFSQ